MEIGILVAAAVAVAAIAAYFYAKNVKDAANNAGVQANNTANSLGSKGAEYADKLSSL